MTLHYPTQHFAVVSPIRIERLALLAATLAVMLALFLLAAADRTPVAVGSVDIPPPAPVETVVLAP
jgi:hypothetical protein